MKRAQLEHIIRACGTIANAADIVVIGSQAVLGQFPDAPSELLVSNDADIILRDQPDLSDLIDGTIGEASPFDRSFGYYARGVDYSTATLPDGWRDRLVLLCGENTLGIRGWCLEVHDLAISKYVAGREKDRDFTRVLAKHGMVLRDVLVERLAATTVSDEVRALVAARIDSDFRP